MKHLIPVAVAAVLAGCGGGGSSADPAPTSYDVPPVTNGPTVFIKVLP